MRFVPEASNAQRKSVTTKNGHTFGHSKLKMLDVMEPTSGVEPLTY